MRSDFVKEVRQEARHEARQLARQLALVSTSVEPSTVAQMAQRQLADGLHGADSTESADRKLARTQSARVMSIFPVAGSISVLGVRPRFERSFVSPLDTCIAASVCGSMPTPGTSRAVLIRASLTWFGVHSGRRCRMAATTPDTTAADFWGAILLPPWAVALLAVQGKRLAAQPGRKQHNGHGTHFAGLIAGNSNNRLPADPFDSDYVGTAPDANLISIKISDDAGKRQPHRRDRRGCSSPSSTRTTTTSAFSTCR